MEKATISQVKNQLSAYLEKVRTGETVLILDRNQPVARLERILTQDDPEGRLQRLERIGVLRRASQPLPLEYLRSKAPTSEHSVLAVLLEERESGR